MAYFSFYNMRVYIKDKFQRQPSWSIQRQNVRGKSGIIIGKISFIYLFPGVRSRRHPEWLVVKYSDCNQVDIDFMLNKLLTL